MLKQNKGMLPVLFVPETNILLSNTKSIARAHSAHNEQQRTVIPVEPRHLDTGYPNVSQLVLLQHQLFVPSSPKDITTPAVSELSLSFSDVDQHDAILELQIPLWEQYRCSWLQCSVLPWPISVIFRANAELHESACKSTLKYMVFNLIKQ